MMPFAQSPSAFLGFSRTISVNLFRFIKNLCAGVHLTQFPTRTVQFVDTVREQ